LALAAVALVVIGLVSDDGLGLVYASIACSAAASLLLVASVVARRPRAVEAIESEAIESEATESEATEPEA
jgi:hypothetical protein